MYYLLGQKEVFAVEMDIISYRARLWGKNSIFLRGERVGHFEEENYIAPLIHFIYRIAAKPFNFWMDELEGLSSCKEIFLTINPGYNGPFDFSVFTDEKLKEYDKFLTGLDENYDDWAVNVVCKGNNCKFLWVHYPLRDSDTFEVRNNIQCFDVPLKNIIDIYTEICTIIPDESWPPMIKKISG